MREIGLYINIPFCIQKCFYCDFCSFDKLNELQTEYIDALVKEIKNTKNKDELCIKTIYIGGGTPSVLEAKKVELILSVIKENFKFCNNCEITIEINPGTVNEEKLRRYKNIGINRLSIGLQSTNDEILKSIGRIHNYKQFEQVYETARNVGFNNINIDLMIGLPNQKLSDVENSINDVIEKNPEHISVYSLILEEETKLKELVDAGKMKLPDEDTERAMYWKIKKVLENKGYNQYEISNFSKQNYESKHNTDCWNQREYIGFGIAAHSYYNNIRYSNICDIKKYINNISINNFEENIIIHEVQEKHDKMNEYMILGLRMIKGIDMQLFQEIFSKNIYDVYGEIIEKLKRLSLISNENGTIKLTDKGIDFANIVWEEFV